MRWLLTIWLLFFLCFTGEAKSGDTLSVHLDWQGVHRFHPAENQSFSTLRLDEALYLPDLNYLPGIELNIEGKAFDLEILNWTGDTLTAVEQRIFDNLYHSSFRQFQQKFRKLRDQTFTDVLVFPFVYDTLEDRFYKISSFDLRYTLAVSETSSSKALRTASEENSVLATGPWYKIAVLENAVYKVDREFLGQMGINVDKIDPRKIRVYGNGGSVLPQSNDAPRIGDLYENAVSVAGESDGKFDEGDYLLFYGQSPHKIRLDSETKKVTYENNFYSDTTYYFLTISDTEGKRTEARENLGNNYPAITSYNDLQFHENDDVNIINSGREWYGERFDATLSRSFAFDFEGAVSGTSLELTVAALGQSYAVTTMEVSANGQKLGEMNFFPIPEGAYFTKGNEEIATFLYDVKPDENSKLDVELNYKKAGGVKSSAYLNYLTLTFERALIKQTDPLLFRSLESTENMQSTFLVQNLAENAKIWDITFPLEPVEQKFDLENSVGKFGTGTEGLKNFIVFDPGKAPKPTFIKAIANQNLKAQPVPDLIIVSHPDFFVEANRLAAHRESHNGIRVLVTTPEMIYNEFSSGSQDVSAIRDMARYFYDKGNRTGLKNLLLFGKCSFDYKNREPNNTNFVPTYSSRNSTHPVTSYSSDDYYAILEEGEGEWEENYSGDHTLDIGIGRLPVKTREEAMIVVDKLIHYDTHPDSYGEWRNQLTFVADDGDGNIHQEDAEDLTVFLDTAHTRFNIRKIYVDAFAQTRGANGESAPEVNKAVNNAVSKGSLLVNFTGHGSETRWCSETVLDINMIKKWTNIDHLPLFVTATCEFGKHDDPAITSGAEFLLLNSEGGAIGLVTTSRPVYSNTNYDINLAFYKSVFERDENGYFDLGTIFKNTKNGSLRGSNNRNFSLLGDPSMKLALAEHDIEIVAEPQDAKSPGDTLNALELIKLRGKIVDAIGQDHSGFDGTLTATVFDKSKTVQTLGGEGAPFTYTERNNVIFKGDATVDNGSFSLEFVVPKNISYQLEKGKISLYAKNTLGSDAAGSDLSFTIGGSGPFIPDNGPPDITLFVNDTTFEERGITGNDVVALAKLFDESGLNILNDGVNPGIAIRVDDEDFKYAGDFFKNDLDNYRQGWLRYPFFELEEGLHTITVGAYDTHNNYSESEIELFVTNSEKFVAQNLFNYPNPFSDETFIAFEHNRAGEDLEIFLEIFSLKGQKVYSGSQVTFASPAKINDINWNGRSTSGKKLEAGLYVYVVSIRSLKDSSNIKLSNKLLIIN